MRKFIVNVNGNSYEVEVEEVGGAQTAAPAAVAPVQAAAPSQAPKAAPAAVAAAGGVTAEEMAAATAAILASQESAVGEGEVKLIGVSEENAAMIMAILCDELGCSPAELVFHSITAL